MKKILKWGCLGFLAIIGLVFIAGIFASSENDNEKVNLKSETKELAISADSMYSKAQTFYNEKNYKYAKSWAEKLVVKDTMLKEANALLNKINTGISKKIKELETLPKNKSKFRTKYDEFKKITWYNSVHSRGYGNKVYIYFGVNDNGTVYSPRFCLKYYGDDWIFWETAVFLIDGESYNYDPGVRPKRDNNSSVWESIDVPLKGNILNIVGTIINSKETKYRLIGRYSFDRKLSTKQKVGLQDVLEAYKSFNEIEELKNL